MSAHLTVTKQTKCPHCGATASEALTKERAIELYDTHGSVTAASKATGVSKTTFARKLDGARSLSKGRPAKRPPRLGTLCARGHDHEGTGKSMRYARDSGGACIECFEYRKRSKRGEQDEDLGDTI